MTHPPPKWTKEWTWPWANGRRRVPLRGLEVMEGRRRAVKVWRWGGPYRTSYEVRADRA